MIKSRRFLLVAIAIPILGLAMLTAYKSSVLKTGREVTLPIEGYDPRDLLSGHYLIYRVMYDVSEICGEPSGEAFVCVSSKTFSYSRPDSCEILIRGSCVGSRFVAGLERFYIPEGRAKELEKAVIEKRGSIVISTTVAGDAQVKSLLIDGKPWR